MPKPKTINEYLASVPVTHKAGLKLLSAQIKKLYPKATEHISYSAPLFKLEGHPLAGFAAHKKHSSIFVWSGTAFQTLGNKLDTYDHTLGTVRFAPDKPLPLTIVTAILKAREKEIKEKYGSKKKK